MKRIGLLFSSVLALIIMSCGSGTDGSSSDKEISKEPNNSIDKANPVSIGTEFKMSIDKEGDIDWYKVEIKEQGYLQAMTKDVPEDLDIQVRFAKYDEWGDTKEDFITQFRKTPATEQLLEEGTYYIMVAERWGEKFSKEEFTLKIDFIKEFDEFEPNADPTSATQIELEKEYQSAIFPISDEDWFKLEIEEQGYIEIKSKDASGDLDLAVFFATYDEYSDKKITVIKNKNKIPQELAISEPGEYYFAFADRWDGNQSQDLFSWVVNFIPEMDDFEPNNEKIDAKEISGNETIMLAIFPLEDKDIFKFTPQSVGNLSIKGKDFGSIEPAVRIYKLDENDKLEEIAKFVLPGEFELPEANIEYYIQITDNWDSNSSKDLFELIFEYK